jgi:hypothetical protein
MTPLPKSPHESKSCLVESSRFRLRDRHEETALLSSPELIGAESGQKGAWTPSSPCSLWPRLWNCL